MKFGGFLLSQAPGESSPGDVLRAGLRQVALAEELGFDSVWLAEHHQTSYCVVSDALTFAAYAAAVTSRIRLGIAVSVLPLHHPLEIAERATLVDILSDGRLTLGVGRGYSATEFHTYGLDLPTRRDRFEEALDIILKCWSEERFDYDGEFWKLRDVSLYPRPVQSPHPQVLVATSGTPETAARIAGRGLPFILGHEFLSPRKVGDLIETYRQRALASGLSEAAVGVLLADSWLSLKVHLADTTREAKALAGPYALWRFRKGHELQPSMSGPALMAKVRDRVPGAKALITNPENKPWAEVTAQDMAAYDLYGTPEDVTMKIDEYRAVGVRNIICSFDFGGMPEMVARRSMKLFAAEVAPAFQGKGALAAGSVKA
jgi:alkanesulfonate monooxygenase SsuD/methylene tetrahydromethanopterin reductase-like flavin-dependent oxidoreductase (luciferase family)